MRTADHLDPATRTPHQADEGVYDDRAAFDAARDRLRRAAAAYYDSDRLEMDDATYDALARRLAATEAANPDWVERSVTEVAAGAATSGSVTHEPAMLSLDNVFDSAELDAFCQRGARHATWVVEPKLDGLAASATYQAGRLVLLATRGDGRSGEDITAHHADLCGLPAQLGEPADLVVRGELYMSDEQFARANEIRAEHGDAALANPRNGAAGAMRSRHGRYRLPVSFAAYGCPTLDHLDQDQLLARLAMLGIATSAALGGTSAIPAGQVSGAVEDLNRRRSTLGFPVDGAVIKLASAQERARLGDTFRAPRWAVAYKFPPDSRLTRLTGIEVTVGRTGVLTPVATLEPVSVGGATITSATCSNPSEVVRKDLRVGDMVWVRRAGDVIPEIVSVQLAERPADAAAWQPPAACPRCGGKIERGSRRWRCPNRSCGALEAIEYFASRDAMDIDGLGPAAVATLVAAGLVSDPADLYHLRADEVAALDGFGQTRAENLIAAIAASASQPLNRVVCALGLRSTGRVISRRLARAFPTLEALADADADALAAVEGIGAVKAQIIAQELADLSELVERLTSVGLGGQADPAPATGGDVKAGPLAGKKVVVTGTVPGYSRTEASELVERLGGQAVSSVSRNTDLLVVGAGAGGSKLARAAELGVATVTAEELLVMTTGG